MWGAQSKAEYRRPEARPGRRGQQRRRCEPALTGPQNPAVQPYTTTDPASVAPIPGERTYPSGTPQQGAIPNPGQGPQ